MTICKQRLKSKILSNDEIRMNVHMVRCEPVNRVNPFKNNLFNDLVFYARKT